MTPLQYRESPATYDLEPLIRPLAIPIGMIHIRLLRRSAKQTVLRERALDQIPALVAACARLEEPPLVRKGLAAKLAKCRALCAGEEDLLGLLVLKAEHDVLGWNIEFGHGGSVIEVCGKTEVDSVCGKMFLRCFDEMIVFTWASCSDYIVFNS